MTILCIHGYRQNEKMFREKTGAFRKIVGKHADLVFITAPHAVQPMNEEDSNQVTYDTYFLPIFTLKILLSLDYNLRSKYFNYIFRISGDGGLVAKMIISKLMIYPIVIKVRTNLIIRKRCVFLCNFAIYHKSFSFSS